MGNYLTLTGKADRIDPVFRTLQVGDTVVPFEDLVEVSGEVSWTLMRIWASGKNEMTKMQKEMFIGQLFQ